MGNGIALRVPLDRHSRSCVETNAFQSLGGSEKQFPVKPTVWHIRGPTDRPTCSCMKHQQHSLPRTRTPSLTKRKLHHHSGSILWKVEGCGAQRGVKTLQTADGVGEGSPVTVKPCFSRSSKKSIVLVLYGCETW